MAQPLGQHGQCTRGVHPLLQLLVAVLGLLRRTADDGEHTGHQVHLRWVAVPLAQLAFQTPVENAGLLQRLLGGEDDIGRAGCQRLAGLGRARLDHDGVALRRARCIQRAFDAEMRALVVQRVQLGGVEVHTAVLVAHDGIVLPAVPQPLDHVDKLAGHRIALGMVGVVATGEIGGRAVVRGGDHVPGGPALREQIQRGERAGNVVGLAVGCRGRGCQANVAGGHGQGRQQRQRLKAQCGRRVHVGCGAQAIGQEDHVELGVFSGLGQALDQAQVFAARLGIGVAPASHVVAGALQEQAQAHLAGSGGRGHACTKENKAVS